MEDAARQGCGDADAVFTHHGCRVNCGQCVEHIESTCEKIYQQRPPIFTAQSPLKPGA